MGWAQRRTSCRTPRSACWMAARGCSMLCKVLRAPAPLTPTPSPPPPSWRTRIPGAPLAHGSRWCAAVRWYEAPDVLRIAGGLSGDFVLDDVNVVSLPALQAGGAAVAGS
jgi:hypothetical protein